MLECFLRFNCMSREVMFRHVNCFDICCYKHLLL